MFFLSRKAIAKADPTPIVREGFFSTDSNERLPLQQRIDNAYKRSIQKTCADLKPVGMDGKELPASAMDGFDLSDIQAVKLENAGLSTPVNALQFEWYASQGFIGYQTAAIIAQQWLVRKCCIMPARDAVRHGYEVTVNDGTDVGPDVLDEIRKLDKRYKIKKKAVEFINMGRVFGIRIAMFKVDSDDKDYYSKPFNPDGVKPGSYRGISQIDPYWITPVLDQDAATDPSGMHFYEPTWWQVQGQRIHRSHLVIFRNGDVPDILKRTYFYGGIPVPQLVMERIYAAERTANEAPLLALTKRTNAIHVDVAKAMANLRTFTDRMEQWSYFQNNYGIKVLGKEETMEQFDTSLTDLDAVIMTQYQIVAAAAGVPATKLLGTSPKGFNASGEFEQDSYHEELESIQEDDITPLIDRHHLLLIRSEIAPKFKMKPFEVTLSWNAVDSPGAKEQAEINLIKAQTGQQLVTSGAIDGFDERARISADKDSYYNGIPEVVPNGPGDREHEQEVQEELLANTSAPGESKGEKKEQLVGAGA